MLAGVAMSTGIILHGLPALCLTCVNAIGELIIYGFYTAFESLSEHENDRLFKPTPGRACVPSVTGNKYLAFKTVLNTS